MASLYIAEFRDVAFDSFGRGIGVAQGPPLAEQKLTISGSSNPSAAFNSNTKYIRVETDAICSIALGAAPTATTDNMRFAANQTEYFGVHGGLKLAVITNT